MSNENNIKFPVGTRVRIINETHFRNGEIGYVEKVYQSEDGGKNNYCVHFGKDKRASFFESKLQEEPCNILEEVSKKASDNLWESFDKEFIEKLERLESSMLYSEFNPLDPMNQLSFLESRSRAEDEMSLESMSEVLYEKSHGELKYTYRIGYDVDSGKLVAVEFELESDKITQVGNPKMTKQAQHYKSDTQIQKTHDTALKKVWSFIKKGGHIDHVTKPLKVNAIFSRDGKRMNKTRLVPFLNKSIIDIVFDIAMNVFKINRLRELKDIIEEIDTLLQTEKFQKELAKKLKTYSGEIEEYHFSKNNNDKQGGDKYKSTKLFWGYSKFTSLQYTPVVRGYIKRNNDMDNINSQENMLKNYDVTNKPRKGSDK